MKKRTGILLILLAFGIMYGCSNDTVVDTSSVQDLNNDLNLLVGTWNVGGLLYEDKIIDTNDNDGLKSLYDTSAEFNEDGTFLITDVFLKRGTYTRTADDSEGNHCFLLDVHSQFTYEIVNGELSEKQGTSDSPNSYMVTVIKDDVETMVFMPYDRIMNKTIEEDISMIFVKEGMESKYIQNNKVLL